MIWIYVAIYAAIFLACVPLFVIVDKWTGPHYGSGSSTAARTGNVFLKSLFWPVCVPGTLLLLVFGILLGPLFDWVETKIRNNQ